MGALSPNAIVPDGDIGNLDTIRLEVKLADGEVFPAINLRDPRAANTGHLAPHRWVIENLQDHPPSRAKRPAELGHGGSDGIL